MDLFSAYGIVMQSLRGVFMNIINIEHISKIYGEKIIYADASFGVQQGDKIGIVGINGTGKSTLLRMIAGEEVPDEGQIIKQNGLKIAYVPQNPVFPEGADIRSYAFSKGDGEDWQVESNLMELGITQFDQKIEHLSGGQKRRVVLAKTLAEDFDVLLLDEPTNHLDGEMITWLEEYLRSYRGTVLMVTHDRYFLDRYAAGSLRSAAERCTDMMRIIRDFLSLKRQERRWSSHPSGSVRACCAWSLSGRSGAAARDPQNSGRDWNGWKR